MDRPRDSWEVATTDNLLVVKGNGRFLSRRVSQVYGLALLGAMALRVDKLPFVELHISFLAHHEPWTRNEIRNTAQVVASGDNFMFIDDGRKILSCRVNPDYGVALLEGIEHIPAEAFQALNGLSRGMVAPASEIGNDRVMKVESPQHTSQESRQAHAFSSSPPPSTTGTPANNTRILSDQILSSANRQPYDRDWMKKYSISEDCLDGCQSKHKLDALLRQGAVKVGDKLCVAYHSSGGPVVKTGEVLQHRKKGRLDLRISPARGDFDGILQDCKGPEDVIRGMDREFRVERPSEIPEAWKAVVVVSGGGEEVGSLEVVRQAYKVFEEEMEEWGRRNRRFSP
ncbi:MAG: hypothetical protein ASARMPREDX12_006595 [Alectoria sarmentosa]|nr:MAG: hypothetical protein ASARMPREDX12_006595 [Alectoria sarmentosa]